MTQAMIEGQKAPLARLIESPTSFATSRNEASVDIY